MLKLSAPIVEIEGSIGGTVYWRDQCIQHARAKTPHRDADTVKQRRVRKAFRQCLNAWARHAWTKAETDSWWVWSWHHPKKNKKGEKYYLNPFLAFISHNMYRFMTGLGPVFTAPDD